MFSIKNGEGGSYEKSFKNYKEFSCQFVKKKKNPLNFKHQIVSRCGIYQSVTTKKNFRKKLYVFTVIIMRDKNSVILKIEENENIYYRLLLFLMMSRCCACQCS